jgi:hypothetical protein
VLSEADGEMGALRTTDHKLLPWVHAHLPAGTASLKLISALR